MVSVEEAKRQIDELTDKLDKVSASYTQIHMIERIFFQISGLIKKLTGGNEAIDAATSKLQQFITTVLMAQRAVHAFELATGPVGWAYFLTMATVTGISMVSYDASTNDAIQYEVNAH